MFTSGFFNAINEDRKYSSEQMSQLFDGLITDGIFLTIGSQMMITADENMTVILETGRAWFNHTWSLNDTRMPLDLDGSSDIYDRIDAIVLEVNSDPQVRKNAIKILKGTNAESNPQQPTLEKSYYVHQYPLAYISIPKRTKAITQALITNMVGTSETPFVTGILQGINIDSLVAQWQDEWAQMTNANQEEFDTWFAEIQGQLAGDIATNLQQQINEQTAVIQQAVQDIGVLQQNMNTLSDILSGDFESLQATVSGLQTDISGLQSSLSGKQDTITGGVSTGLTSNYTASRALQTDSSGKVAVSGVTATELGYLSGATSNIQTQLSNLSKADLYIRTHYTYYTCAAADTNYELSPSNIPGIPSDIPSKVVATIPLLVTTSGGYSGAEIHGSPNSTANIIIRAKGKYSVYFRCIFICKG